MVDVVNSLKSKKIILDYEFVSSLHSWPRVKIVLKNINVVVQFWRSDRIDYLDIYHEEKANHINVYINRIKKDVLFEFLKSKITQRNIGYENEIAFEKVLIIFKKEGFISDYRKSTTLEDMNQDFDWLVFCKKSQIKINIKSSIYGVNVGRKKDILYLQFVHTSDLSYDLLHDIRQKIEKYHKAMVP